MNGQGRAMVWLVVVLSVVLVVVAAGGAFMVLREREQAASEKRLAEAARQQLAEEKRRTAEAERRAAAAGGHTGGNTAGGNMGGDTGGQRGGQTGGSIGKPSAGLAAFRGRKAWVVTKSRPAKDYCAILRRAGVIVRCAYATNKVKLHVLILRCPVLTEAHGRALLKALGLNLRINNWQREKACGKYHEITIYLND